MGNPIRYQDFFDFSDDGEIKKAIRDINNLKKAYADFVGSVVNEQMAHLTKQQAELAASIRDVVAASKDMNVTSKDSQKALLEQSTAMAAHVAAMDKVTRAKTAVKDTEQVLANSVDGLTARLHAQLAEYNKLDPTVEHNRLTMLSLAKATQQTRDAINQLTKETKLSSNEFTAARGSYAALDAETKGLVQQLKQLEGGMSGTNATAAQLQKQIFANTEKLKLFDAAMNQNFRNVGNYKSAFNGLNVATSQIFRELPSAAISLNTFFLAISNNLPILFDEIARTKKQIQEMKEASVAAAAAASAIAKEQSIVAGATEEAANAAGDYAKEQALAAAQGTKGTSVLKALAGAIFSWNTLLTIGVTLLTFFGGSIVNFFTGASEASKESEAANKKYAESLKEIDRTSYATAATEVARMELLYRSAVNVKLSTEQRIASIDALKKSWPEYFAGLEREAILNGKAASAIRDATNAIFAKAAGKANLDKFDAASKVVSDIKDKLDETKTAIQSLNLDDVTKRYIAAEEKRQQLDRRGLSATKEYSDAVITTRTLINYVNSQQLADYKKLSDAQETYSGQLYGAQIQQQNFFIKAQQNSADVDQITNKLMGAGRTPARVKKDLDDINKLLEHTPAGAERTKQMKQQVDLQAELDRLEGKKTDADKQHIKDQKEFLTLLQKRIAVIKATADADVAEAELGFQGTARTSYDQETLEKRKRDIIVKAAEEQQAITAKGTKLYEDATKQKEVAERNFAKAQHDILEERYKNEIEVMDKLRERRESEQKAHKAALEEEAAIPLDQRANEINLAAASGTMSQTTAERKLHDLRVEIINSEIAERRRALNAAVEGTEDFYIKRRALLEKERELVNSNADFEIKKAEEVRAKKAAIVDASFQFVTSLASAATSATTDNYDVELEALTQQKDYELTLAGDNKEAKKKIEQEFAKEQSRIRRDQAEAAKFEALFDIAINTAQAVVKAVAASPTTFGLPFSAFAAATGLIQGSIVAARPIPKYKIGRLKGKSEVAEINEEGFELVERNGRMRVEGAGKRVLTYLSSEDRVYTHKESVKMLAAEYSSRSSADAFAGSISNGIGIYAAAQQSRDNALANALMANGITRDALAWAFRDGVSSLPIEQHSFDEAGYRKFVRKGNTRIEELHERQKIGGNG